MPEIACLICGKRREVFLADIARGGGKYCSRACFGVAQRTSVDVACPICGNVFSTIPARMADGRGKYCSRPCAIAARKPRHGHNTRRRGQTPTYVSWNKMQQRCDNPNDMNYHHYGGRGITVCDRWRTFENFLADMGERLEGMSLDRIDVNGNYEPGNCRWATMAEQKRNTRQTFRVTYAGKEYCLRDLARELGLCEQTLRQRIGAGWPQDRWNAPSQVGPNHVSRRGNALPLA